MDALYTPLAFIYPSTGAAVATEAGSGEPYPVAEFADAADESVFLEGILIAYGSGGLDIDIKWRADTATTGNVIWRARVSSVTDDADDTDSHTFGSWVTATADTTASAAGEIVTTTISLTDGAQIDSLADGEAYRIEVQREGTNASDTMTDEAQVLHMRVKDS